MKLPFVGTDEYDRHARLKPALVAFLPVTLTALALVVQAGGSYALAQIIGDIGKKKEAELFKKFGGRPTDRLLSHKTAPNKTILAMRHAKLAALMGKARIPTAKAEERDAAGAADVYAACVDFLRGKCRQNAAVFRENRGYGFRRNLWAIKKGGVIAATVGIVLVAAEFHRPVRSRTCPISG